MQDILHTSIIAIPAIFAALMVLDLIATLKQAWSNYKPSTPISIPASTLQPLPEVAAPAVEIEKSEIVPDPWELEAFVQPIATTSRLTLVPRNLLLLLPAAKSAIEVVEVAEVVATAKRQPGRPKKQVVPTVPAAVTPKRKAGRPRKTA